MGPAGRLTRGVGRVLRTHYPGFVFGLPLGRADVPVFTYHDVERADLARDLDFLQTNSYRTVSLDEFTDASSPKAAPGRRVLLTFDDARKSFWNVALPLLREYDAHAVLFAPTRWMTDHDPSAAGADRFMSWSELGACLETGLVDVQSHGHRHALVHTDARLVDFASPSALETYDIYDWPMRGTGDSEQFGPPPLGTPIYRAAPLLSAQRRFLESEELAAACRQLVEREGGPDFFREHRWERRLRGLHRQHAEQRRGSFLPIAELRRMMRSEFECSRQAFASRLGYAPTYFAYPWMLGSRTSLDLARAAGIRAAFGVALDYDAANDRSLPIPVYGRLKSDWIRLLPGTGRSSALTLFGRKLTGFGHMQNLAH